MTSLYTYTYASNKAQGEYITSENETMLSSLPQSVREEGWEAWEAQRMQREDFDVTKHETSDSEMSCLSVADSPITRRRKLDTNDLTQSDHLRSIKRKAQKAAHNAHSRGKSKN